MTSCLYFCGKDIIHFGYYIFRFFGLVSYFDKVHSKELPKIFVSCEVCEFSNPKFDKQLNINTHSKIFFIRNLTYYFVIFWQPLLLIEFDASLILILPLLFQSQRTFNSCSLLWHFDFNNIIFRCFCNMTNQWLDNEHLSQVIIFSWH